MWGRSGWLRLAILVFSLLAVAPATASAHSDESARPSRFVSVVAHLKKTHRGVGRGDALRAAASSAPQAPYDECPPVGDDSSCEILLDVTSTGTQILQDPSQGPYDGSDDTLVGIVNNSSSMLTSIQLSSSNPIFGFDQDGICSGAYDPEPSGCPYGTTGYEGPNTSFTGINASTTGGTVVLSPGVAPGGTDYFSLEEPLTTTTVFSSPSRSEQGGAPNESELSTTCSTDRPVNCATGTFWHTFTDASVPGLGVPLDFTRTYSSADAGTDGPFGYGWTDSYNMSASFDAAGDATITQEDGSTITFDDSNGSYVAPPWVLGTFQANGDGTYTLTRDHSDLRYMFNSDGQLISETDQNGYATTLSYNGAGQLTQVADQAGRTLALTYNGDGQISSLTDPDGDTTTYSYDPAGDLVKTTDPASDSWTFGYDANHLLTSMTDPDNGTTTNTYDSSDQVVSQSDPMGHSTTFAYTGDPASSSGGTTTITDPNGFQTVHAYSDLELDSVTEGVGTSSAATWTYTYDPATLGRATITDPDGHVTQNSYDAQGDLLSTQDPSGDASEYTYNPSGEVSSETDANGHQTDYSYDSGGNLTQKTITPSGGGTVSTWTYTYGTGNQVGDRVSATDPDDNTTHYGYDTYGDVTSITDAMGNTMSYTYDADGLLKSTTTALGDTTRRGYTRDGELSAITDPLGTTSYTYDGDGNQLSVTNADNQTTTYSYDADDEQTSVTEPDGSTSYTGYDGDGNVVTQTNGAGQVTRYAYDPLDRLKSDTTPDGETTLYAYDGDGNEVTKTNPSGGVTQYGYDDDDQLQTITYDDGTTPDVSSETYDGDGNRTSMTDGTGTSQWTYDALGDISSYTDGAGATVGYAYDADGNLKQITYPNGQSVTRQYNEDEQLKSVTDWLGNTTTFGYNGDGYEDSEQLPGSVDSTLSYDADDRVAAINDTNGSRTIADFSYVRDALGQVKSATTNGAVTGSNSYSYDSDDRLTGDGTDSYSYDAANNPTTFAGQPQTFNGDGELTRVGASGTATGPGSPAGIAPTTTGTTPKPVTTATGLGRSLTKASGGSAPVVADSTASTDRLVHNDLTLSVRPRRRGDLLLAMVSVHGTSTAPAIARPRALGLRWTRVQRRAVKSQGVALWQARVAHRLKKTSVTVRLSGHASHALMAIVIFRPSAVIGPRRSADGSHGRPSLHLRATTGAQLWGVGADNGSAMRPAPLTGSQIMKADTVRQTSSWIQRASVTHSGTTRFGDHAPRSSQWLIAAVAIRTSARHADSQSVRALVMGDDEEASALGSARTFSYNADGDRTGVISSAGTLSLSYDEADRLTDVGSDISYSYDGDGLRMSSDVDANVTQFTWDESGSLPLLLQVGDTNYIYGPSGQPIEQITGDTPTFLLADQQGSVRVLTDAGGNVVGTYDYDSWGNVTTHTGSASTNLQYDGQYTDPETGFEYLRARYYDPSTGQFLTIDPEVNVTNNAYIFSENSPLNDSDPTGANVLSDIGGSALDEAFRGIVDSSKDLSKSKALGVVNPVSDIQTVVSAEQTLQHCGAFLTDAVTGEDGHAQRLDCGGSVATTANDALGLFPGVGAGVSVFLDEVTSEGHVDSGTGWYDDNPCDALYGHVLS